jgi:Tfp pilus assembly protein PilX
VHHPRGNAALGILLIISMLQIIIAAIVLAGARSDDMTGRRLEAARAFYAAEAGANMAIREEMLGTDEDGDGKAGSISDDGNAANDPAVGPARVYASALHAPGQATITVTARAGEAARKLTILIN